MNRNFYIRADLDTLRQTKAIKRLENTFMMLTRAVGLAVIECSAEHVSPASEWMNPSQTDSLDFFDGGPGVGPEGKSSKWCPAVG